jgi:putative transposase
VDEAGSRPGTNPRLWSCRKPVLVKDTVGPKVNIVGFYTVNGNSSIDIVDNTRPPSFCTFLELVRETNPGKKILLVLDNYKPHHVETTLVKARELGIILVHLPPYSPDLNPIEQIWRVLKKQLALLYLLTKEELITAIRKIYRALSAKTSFGNK